MAPQPDDLAVRLSDKELLDEVEKLLGATGFIDLCLGYDPTSGTFYAGGVIASNLRDVLRRVLSENSPGALSAGEMTACSCSGSKSNTTVRSDTDLTLSSELYSTAFPLT